MATLRRVTKDAVDAKMDPYVMALGRVAHSWNYLQEALGQVFCAVTGLEINAGPAIWHSTTNDRTQREMLRAAMRASNHRRSTADLPKAKDDIKWLLDKADGVAEQRNTAVHAPMSVSIGNADIELFPVVYNGNPRANKWIGKDILTEFEWYEKSADTLTVYARTLRNAIVTDTDFWPARPQMPTLQLKSMPAHKGSRP